jgi:preprotein translocase subunit SecY
MPYISASIIVQLLTALFPYFMALKKEGDTGKRKLSQYTRYLTVGIASMQASALSSFLMSRPGIVYDPGVFFLLTVVVTIVSATLFLMWLGEQITSRGVGNGSSMIIYAGIMASLPAAIFRALELGRTGGLALSDILVTGFSIVGVVLFV